MTGRGSAGRLRRARSARWQGWASAVLGAVLLMTLAAPARAQENSTSGPAVLVPADLQPNDNFGNCLALSGPWLAVGSLRHPVNGQAERGAVYLYEWGSSGWAPWWQAVARDGQGGDYFGAECLLQGNLLFVAALRADVDGRTDQGAVYVFEQQGGGWQQVQKITAPDGAAGDNFGSALAIFGTTLAVGAAAADNGGVTDRGAVYLYEAENYTWVHRAKLEPPDVLAGLRLGDELALNGDRLLIGAPSYRVNGQRNQGAALIYRRSGGQWLFEVKLTAADGEAGERFGSGVSLLGDTAAVGADHDAPRGISDQGSVYVYRLQGGSWALQTKVTADDGGEDSYYGYAVLLHGDELLVGSWGHAISGDTRQGAAYLYRTDGAHWQLIGRYYDPDGKPEDWFGRTVAYDGAALAVGAPQVNVGNKWNGGQVYVYGRPPDIPANFRGWLPLVER